MKTVIKLLIVAAILNAAVRIGMAAATYYELKDQAQQLITFGGKASADQLQNQIMERATTLQVPLMLDDIMVTRDGLKTVAQASYTQPVEVFPSYEYPLAFQFTVEGLDLSQGSSGNSNPLAN